MKHGGRPASGGATKTGLAYLDFYLEQAAHQEDHNSQGLTRSGLTRYVATRVEQPHRVCLECVRSNRRSGGDRLDRHDVVLRYAWAVPSIRALDLIGEHSPGGVVEIGAGGGYWAFELQRRGVDVVAFDPDPHGTGDHPWHSGQSWTAVHEGDHRKAADYPARTLLMVWPSYDQPWAAQALDVYRGDTVIYVGEGPGGCTGDRRFHQMLGADPSCWCFDVECDCPPPAAQEWREVADCDIPQWAGLHDRLYVYKRTQRIQQ